MVRTRLAQFRETTQNERKKKQKKNTTKQTIAMSSKDPIIINWVRPAALKG